jgi:hypothetical protein
MSVRTRLGGIAPCSSKPTAQGEAMTSTPGGWTLPPCCRAITCVQSRRRRLDTPSTKSHRNGPSAPFLSGAGGPDGARMMAEHRRLRSYLGLAPSQEPRAAAVAVTSDDHGVVLLASPDGEHYRTVERLARSAAEASAPYEQSQAPILSADEVRHTYGSRIARLSLGNAWKRTGAPSSTSTASG